MNFNGSSTIHFKFASKSNSTTYSDVNLSNQRRCNESAKEAMVNSVDAPSHSSDAIVLDTDMTEQCVCNTEPGSNEAPSSRVDVYMCGGCGAYFRTMCKLHKHLLDHGLGGSYRYNHHLRTAFPTFDAICTGTQTDAQEEVQPDQFIVEDDGEVFHDWTNVIVGEKDNSNSLHENISSDTVNIKSEEVKSANCVPQADNHTAPDTDVIDEDGTSINLNQAKWERNENGKINDTKFSTDIATDIVQHTKYIEETMKNDQRNAKVRPQRTKCKSKYSLRSKLAQKSAIVHSLKTSSVPVIKKSETAVAGKIKNKKVEKKYPCNFCEKTYASKNGLKGHLHKTHAGEILKLEKQYNCQWCDRVFDSREDLKQHSTTCENDDRFKCFICDTKNESKDKLFQHLVSHRNETDLKCKLCHREFADEVLMHAHIKRHDLIKHHKMSTNVQCERCGKSYKHKCDLTRHLQYCRDTRSFECEICNQKFKTQVSLKRHSAIHRDDRPFMCHICGYAVKQKTYLTRHMRVHSQERPFPCTTCAVRFASLGGLNRHRKTHTNIKPCVCSYCGKSFTNNWNLRTHERQHTGEAPYKCLHCDARFKQNVLVKLHVKTHHPRLAAEISGT